ncbi:hypothetical protein [Alkalihalobacterium alkalinitrilicum]|uniref:hypothetical protein n=1 Tax=Alkalihalobacterium alkalinitrilicum TaxID=427920 RepID=UPI000994F821|nr:hypothetical protein [Alkalihalobacterium alkalinitrilicum]
MTINNSRKASKKICFAILVHNKKEIIINMLENIRYFCPNSFIVLYNGSGDPGLCEGLGYPVCPSSKKLNYGFTTIYMLEVMKWLQEEQFNYDYLINLDSDALFARRGFEEFIQKEMQNVDYMGVLLGQYFNWGGAPEIQAEWEKWKPIFQLDKYQYLGAFNVGQTYSKGLVDQILSYEKFELFEKNILDTKAWGTDEIVFANLAKRLGSKMKPYPRTAEAEFVARQKKDPFYAMSIRYRPHYTKKEIQQCLKDSNHFHSFIFHPIYRTMQDEARKYIRSLVASGK